MTELIFDGARSRLDVFGTSSVHDIRISAGRVSGVIHLDGDMTGPILRSARLEVPIGGMRTGDPVRDLELRRRVRAWRHPRLVAILEDASEPSHDGAVEVSGTVEFFGATVPTTGTVHLTLADDDALRVIGEHTFDVTDFGFRPPNILGVRIHDEIRVTLDAVAVPAESSS